jgi:outer membrane protein assembly factor BamB
MNPLDLIRPDTRPKMAVLPELKSPIEVGLLWQASVGSAGNSIFSPYVEGGNVYAAARDGTVLKLDAASGKPIWRVNTGSQLSGGVGANAAWVVVGSAEGEVIALDAKSGEMRWRANLSSEILAAPQVAEDIVIARSADSRIFALDILDGKRRWVYQRATPVLTVRGPAGVVTRSQVVYAGFGGGRLVALALNNGGVRWESAVAQPKGATELERVSDVIGIPWTSEREICAVAYQGRIACFDIANGQSLWARDFSSSTGLSADARYVFATDDRGAVHALDRSNGTSFWKQDRLFLRGLTAPFALGRYIVAADVQGQVHFMDRESGALVGRIATDSSGVAAPITGLPRGILVQTRNGGLFAIEPR